MKLCSKCGYFRCRCSGWTPANPIEPAASPAPASVNPRTVEDLPTVAVGENWFRIAHYGPYRGHAHSKKRGARPAINHMVALGFVTDQAGFTRVAYV